MKIRTQDEKEIKIELMMKLFLEAIEKKIEQVNKQGSTQIKKTSRMLMSLFCDKILTVPHSSFIQYIPFFIILKAKARQALAIGPVAKDSCCELLFTTCFISELIHRSFPQPTTKQNRA